MWNSVIIIRSLQWLATLTPIGALGAHARARPWTLCAVVGAKYCLRTLGTTILQTLTWYLWLDKFSPTLKNYLTYLVWKLLALWKSTLNRLGQKMLTILRLINNFTCWHAWFKNKGFGQSRLGIVYFQSNILFDFKLRTYRLFNEMIFSPIHHKTCIFVQYKRRWEKLYIFPFPLSSDSIVDNIVLLQPINRKRKWGKHITIG